MIVDIALGVVLAVIILALLPLIVVLGAYVVGAGLAILAIGAVLYFFWGHPDVLGSIAVLAGCFALLTAVSMPINRKWPHLDTVDVMGAIFFAALWLVSAAEVVTDASLYFTQYPLSIAVVVGVGVGGGLFLRRWNTRKLNQWREKQAIADSYKAPEALQDSGRIAP